MVSFSQNSESSKSASVAQAINYDTPVKNLNPDNLKPCCACPETKAKRDDCFLRTNPDTAQEDCKEFIQKHRECMLGYGFKV